MRTLIAAQDFSLAARSRRRRSARDRAARRIGAGAASCARSPTRSRRAARPCGAIREAEGRCRRCVTSRRPSGRCRRSSRASPMRSANAATCSTAPRRRSRACAARSRTRTTRRATAPRRCCARPSTHARFRTRSSPSATAASSIPVKAEFAGEFPGIVHDTSASGQTLFVEPLEALETNNRVRTLRVAGRARGRADPGRTFARSSAREAAQIRDQPRRCYVDLDLALARARRRRADERGRAGHRRRGDDRRRTTAAIRCSTSARFRSRSRSDDDVRVIVISGPNMGGKTVALKMVGLFVAMAVLRYARAGGERDDRPVRRGSSPTSATTSRSPQNASTFSAHLRPLARDRRASRCAFADPHRRDRRAGPNRSPARRSPSRCSSASSSRRLRAS